MSTEDPEGAVSLQGVVDALINRIAALEFEVAVLRSALDSQRRAAAEPEEEEPEHETGQYL